MQATAVPSRCEGICAQSCTAASDLYPSQPTCARASTGLMGWCLLHSDAASPSNAYTAGRSHKLKLHTAAACVLAALPSMLVRASLLVSVRVVQTEAKARTRARGTNNTRERMVCGVVWVANTAQTTVLWEWFCFAGGKTTGLVSVGAPCHKSHGYGFQVRQPRSTCGKCYY